MSCEIEDFVTGATIIIYLFLWVLVRFLFFVLRLHCLPCFFGVGRFHMTLPPIHMPSPPSFFRFFFPLFLPSHALRRTACRLVVRFQMTLMSSLQTRLRNFRGHLEAEEEASVKVRGLHVPQY